jgi:hypothetical protein
MRKTFVVANSQHLPEDLWFVTGVPSWGILMLKFCVSEITVDRCVRTDASAFDDKADIANRFCEVLVLFP